MPSLRSSTIAALRQRIVSGENGSVKGIPRFSERLAVAQDAVVARRRLDRQPDGFEPADELTNVFLIANCDDGRSENDPGPPHHQCAARAGLRRTSRR